MQQWKFNDPGILPYIGLERIMLPIPDVLHEQDVAVFYFGLAELVQILLQRDKMIFDVEPLIELARTHQRFVNRLGLAVSDDQDSGPLRRHQ